MIEQTYRVSLRLDSGRRWSPLIVASSPDTAIVRAQVLSVEVNGDCGEPIGEPERVLPKAFTPTGWRRLTAEDLRVIRASSRSARTLAARYRVNVDYVRAIQRHAKRRNVA
jgi:hypothetical protein